MMMMMMVFFLFCSIVSFDDDDADDDDSVVFAHFCVPDQELHNPQRDLVLALFISVPLVVLCYVTANVGVCSMQCNAMQCNAQTRASLC